MRFTQAFLAALSAVAAQAVIITNADFSGITVGVPFVITYADAVGPVTVYLGTGDPSNVIQGASVGTSSGSTGSISWTPASGGSFALKIVDAGAPSGPTNPNFSGFFQVAGAVVSSSTTTPSAATTTPASSTPASSTSTSAMLTTTMATTTLTTPPMYNTTTPMTSSSATMSNMTMTTIPTGTSSQSTGGSTGVPTQVPANSGNGLASPIALVMMAVGALLTLN